MTLRMHVFALFAFALLLAPGAFAQKPIYLKEAKPARHTKCLIKVVASINGQTYAFSRLQDLQYTKKDGTRVTATDPAHPWNDCDLIDIGEVTRLSTGLTKSGVNIHIEILPDDAAKKKYVTTYADRREAILEKMEKDETKLMEDYTKMMRWKSSVMYILPGSAATDNEEPVAVYCKLPPGVEDIPSVPREQKRKICSTRYILPGGLGFGYSYLEGTRMYKLTELDKGIRAYITGAAVKVKPAAPVTP